MKRGVLASELQRDERTFRARAADCVKQPHRNHTDNESLTPHKGAKRSHGSAEREPWCSPESVPMIEVAEAAVA